MELIKKLGYEISPIEIVNYSEDYPVVNGFMIGHYDVGVPVGEESQRVQITLNYDKNIRAQFRALITWGYEQVVTYFNRGDVVNREGLVSGSSMIRVLFSNDAHFSDVVSFLNKNTTIENMRTLVKAWIEEEENNG